MNLFILYGQTATGKTAKALELANLHNGEIVNFDSRQIYKKLDIVTGKDISKSSKLKAERLKLNNQLYEYYELSALGFQPSARIWLYDIVDPKNTFSSAEYVELAIPLLQDILARGKNPILVGGTGYYLRHLLYGVPEIEVKEDWRLRKTLESLSVTDLQTMLGKLNGKMLEVMNGSDISNPRRLIRRIEIATHGGNLLPPQSEITLTARLGTALTFLPFFHSSPEVAREKIALRVQDRIKNGAMEEVKGLLAQGYTKTDPGLNAIGYQQLISYLSGGISLEEAISLWTTKEVQYAKRQKTYFKKMINA